MFSYGSEGTLQRDQFFTHGGFFEPSGSGVLVAVPNVVGLTQTAATTSIGSAFLVVGTVTTASSSTVPLGNVISYDIEKQCRAVFENVRLVLEDAGASWNDIVDVTVFLTNIKKDFPTYNKLYAEHFAGSGKPNPTRTTIEITALPTPIAIELKVIAGV